MFIAAIIILFILTLLTLFQLALIVGAPLGLFAWGGQHRVLPTKLRMGSVLSIGIYAFLAVLVCSKAEFASIISSGTLLDISLWAATVYLATGILLNALSRSKLERYTMTPVVTVLVICFSVVALG